MCSVPCAQDLTLKGMTADGAKSPGQDPAYYLEDLQGPRDAVRQLQSALAPDMQHRRLPERRQHLVRRLHHDVSVLAVPAAGKGRLHSENACVDALQTAIAQLTVSLPTICSTRSLPCKILRLDLVQFCAVLTGGKRSSKLQWAPCASSKMSSALWRWHTAARPAAHSSRHISGMCQACRKHTRLDIGKICYFGI